MNRRLGCLVPAGALGALAAWCVTPDRFWAGWIVWVLFLQTLAMGCLFLVALEHLVGARWSVPLRRVPERLSTLLVPLVPAALLALGALPSLYPGWPPGGAKGLWLGPGCFSGRVLLGLGLQLGCVQVLARGSLAQDLGHDPQAPARFRRFAPGFMAIFALVMTLAAFDWIGGLTPAWYSDILGVYLVAGSILAGLAATTLGVLDLSAEGRLPGVGGDHLYNLGALLFAFSAFWAYIAYCQYLLMWYGNLPEEAAWFQARLEGAWGPFTLALTALHFGLPFGALLPRAAKREPRRLAWVAVLVLVAHLLDLIWLVVPALGQGVLLGWPELALALCFGGGGLLWCRWARRWGADLPVGDPGLARGLGFRL